MGHRRPNPVRNQREIINVTYTDVYLISMKELASPLVQVMPLREPIKVVDLSLRNQASVKYVDILLD